MLTRDSSNSFVEPQYRCTTFPLLQLAWHRHSLKWLPQTLPDRR